MITQIEINLGLENNPWTTKEDIKIMLEQVNFNIFDVENDLRQELSTYNGAKELTMVIATRGVNLSKEDINTKMVTLCVLFEQECIAYKINANEGLLAYHPRFKERYAFSEGAFIDFYNKDHFQKNFK